jgi:copper chaperone CopZ
MVLTFSLNAFAKNYVVGIKGMHCESCVEKITAKFQILPEVESVKINLETESMTLVTKKDKVIANELIKKTVSDAGYTVSTIK